MGDNKPGTNIALVLGLVGLTLQATLVSTLGTWLGSQIAAWLVGIVMVLVGAGIAVKGFKMDLGGVGVGLIGAGFALAGIELFGFGIGIVSSMMLMVVGIAVILVEYAKEKGLVKI